MRFVAIAKMASTRRAKKSSMGESLLTSLEASSDDERGLSIITARDHGNQAATTSFQRQRDVDDDASDPTIAPICVNDERIALNSTAYAMRSSERLVKNSKNSSRGILANKNSSKMRLLRQSSNWSDCSSLETPSNEQLAACGGRGGNKTAARCKANRGAHLSRTQSTASQRRCRFGKLNYSTLETDPLLSPRRDVDTSGSASNHDQKGDRAKRGDAPLLRSSASSPSGFQFANSPLAREDDCLFTSATKISPHHREKKFFRTERKNCGHLFDGDSRSPIYWIPWSSLSSNNLSQQQRSNENVTSTAKRRVSPLVTRAESESLLARARRLRVAAMPKKDEPPFTVAAGTPTEDEDVCALIRARAQTSAQCPAVSKGKRGGADTRSTKFNDSLGAPAGRDSNSSNSIKRRHSGAANSHAAVGKAAAAQCHRTSQPPQQKPLTCSLMMISPNSVSRSPSQQWMNKTSPCYGTVPASPSPTAMIPQASSQQLEPPNVASDHRNPLAPSPNPTNVINNPLYNVSNEFMRVAGYSQQFKSLLSKRGDPSLRKPGHDVVAFTIDNRDKDLEKGLIQTGLLQSELNEQTFLAADTVALSSSPSAGGVGDDEKDQGLDKRIFDSSRPSRKSAYGRLWKEQPNLKHRLKKRKTLFTRRTKVSDFALLFAIAGILLTILEAELTASGAVAKKEYASYFLRSLVVISTIVLISLIIYYHVIETKIAVIDSGAEDWRVAITYDRIWQCALEVVVCSICPFPANINVHWDRLKADHRTPYLVAVPLDAVLSVPLFLRFYLFGRFMALHSRQFQDAATRSIAALNHIAVNFTFVLKTLMHEHPLRVLVLFTVAFWIAMSWILTQCERYGPVHMNDPSASENNHYLNSIWFIIITFMSIGYGDIVPNTYCGRALAITTGIVGAGVSSALIAVISRKLELSRAEKHVNQFMTDSKLTRQRKEAAASVLQHTWFIHKYKNIPKAKDDMKLRMHQRRFLASINDFRRVKWDQRKLAEQGNALVDVAKLQNDMHETLWDMQQNQDHLVSQMNVLMEKVQELQNIMLNQCSQMQTTQTSPFLSGTRAGARKVAARQTSLQTNHSPFNRADGPQLTPIVIAQHVDASPSATTDHASFDDDMKGQAILI